MHHWLSQGGNARYRLRAIYKTDEGCPPSVYKCTRPRTGRNLVWTKEETDTFKGYAIIIIMPIFSICIFEANTHNNAHVLSIHDVGCPVVGKSCSLSSSVPEESNILGVETAHTYGECAGTDTNYFCSLVLRISRIKHFFLFIKKAKICLLLRALSRDQC